MDELLIWNYLTDKSSQPVCSIDEAKKMMRGTEIIAGLALKKLTIESTYFSDDLFHFEAENPLPSLVNRCVIIPEDKVRDISSFIQSNDLLVNEDYMFYVIAMFNKGIAGIRNEINATKSTFGHDIANYGSDINDLNEAIKLYCDCNVDNAPSAENAKMLSITFSFDIHNQKKNIKIENYLLLVVIMDAIREGNTIDPAISTDWSVRETKFKTKFASSLFQILDSSEVSGGDKSEAYIYRLISQVFTLSGIKVSDAGIKKMFQRANN